MSRQLHHPHLTVTDLPKGAPVKVTLRLFSEAGTAYECDLSANDLVNLIRKSARALGVMTGAAISTGID